jgi:uncharacterized cupin superfamily protein
VEPSEKAARNNAEWKRPMTNIETEILIGAPPGEVWRVLTGFEQMAGWNPFITAISGSLIPGARLTVTVAPPGLRTMTFKPFILAVTPERELRWLGAFIGRWLFAGEHYFLLEEVVPHQTLLTHGERFSGLLAPLIMRSAIISATQRGFVAMNEALRERVNRGRMMEGPVYPIAIEAVSAAPRKKPSNYPEPFLSRMAGREKRPLGDLFGLKNFGVNLTTLVPGGESALMHRHSKQDEFIFIVRGEPTLVTDTGEVQLRPGMCAGFPAGGIAHHLVNRSTSDVLYLEIGDRTPGDTGYYPKDDIMAKMDASGTWSFTHKDGQPY